MTSQSSDCKEHYCEDFNSPVLIGDKSTGNWFPFIGEHENQVSESGEYDLHKHVARCKKNPGHQEFIPIELLNLKDLPEGHDDIELYNFIKATADLTVILSVTVTSPDRPEFWPNTKIPYFLSELRGKETLRTGTGKVKGVKKHSEEDIETCPCDKCKTSESPRNVWWTIYVVTAAHVVFDDIEASHTTLRLFYDSEDSELVLIKDKVCVGLVNIVEDWCLFSVVSCDEQIGNKLEKMVKHFTDVWWKVWDEKRQSRDIDRLNFIVSHPHGCCKQVSIGKWKDKVQSGKEKYDHKFTYTTSTCPGSSGAAVNCVGYYSGWSIAPVHSGSLKSGLNYSGVGETR